MFRAKLLIISGIFFTFFCSVSVFAFDYVVNDFNFYSIPNTPKPPRGVTIQDPVFHTDIVRITDALADTGKNYCQPGYPKHDIENADGTKLVIQSYKWPAWHLWNANPPYNKIKDLPPKLVDTKDPDVRWDASDPSILYSTYKSQFLKYNINTDQITVLHDFKTDFPDKPIARVYTAEEGDASTDKRYWAFKIRCYDATHSPTWWDTAYVVYDKDYFEKDNGKIISVLNEGSPLWRSAGFISMSPTGKYVWIGDTHYVYPRDFSSIRSLGCSGHADMAISAEGKEVVVCGKQRNEGYSNMGVWVMMAELETGQQTWLTPMAKGGGVYHISSNSVERPGWAVISVYGPTYPAVATAWDQHTIYMSELTTRRDPPPRVWRVAHSHTVRKGYSDDQFAKINRKGTKIWFGSGWGQFYSPVGSQYDVYQVNLPSTWYQDLRASNNIFFITRALPEVMVGSSYSQTLQITGGTSPYTWSITSGSLPNGLLLNPSTGVISGTPTVPGTFNFTVQVRDATPQTTAMILSVRIRTSDTNPPATPAGLEVIR